MRQLFHDQPHVQCHTEESSLYLHRLAHFSIYLITSQVSPLNCYFRGPP